MNHRTYIKTKQICYFKVEGNPVTKGSMRAFIHKGKPLITNASPATKKWQTKITKCAKEAMQDKEPSDGPISVCCFFFLNVKNVLYKNDLDKLARCVLDALTSVVYTDDSQVVILEARKTDSMGDEACCFIEVSECEILE